MMGKYNEGLRQVYEALEMDKNFPPALLQLGNINQQSGDFSQSINNLEQVCEEDDTPTNLSCLGRSYALAGLPDKAKAVMDHLKAQSARRYVSPYGIALISHALDEIDLTFSWLEKAYEAHDEFLCWVKVDPRFESLRTDERFKDLMNRVFSHGEVSTTSG